MTKGKVESTARVSRIYARDGSLFLWRFKVPKTWTRRLARWLGWPEGRLFLHAFHQGDQDPDPHDHPWEFWTFPLVGYTEDFLNRSTGQMEYREVKPFRLHYRHATHIHRVCDPQGRLPIVTLVWHGKVQRSWGFWVPDGWDAREGMMMDARWVPAAEYLYVDQSVVDSVL